VTLVNTTLHSFDPRLAYSNAEVVIVDAGLAVGLARNELGRIGGWNGGDHGGGECEDDGDSLHGVRCDRVSLKVVVGPVKILELWCFVVVYSCWEREWAA
jgi:hypothetical protein